MEYDCYDCRFKYDISSIFLTDISDVVATVKAQAKFMNIPFAQAWYRRVPRSNRNHTITLNIRSYITSTMYQDKNTFSPRIGPLT